jgi:hypothetical protein
MIGDSKLEVRCFPPGRIGWESSMPGRGAARAKELLLEGANIISLKIDVLKRSDSFCTRFRERRK